MKAFERSLYGSRPLGLGMSSCVPAVLVRIYISNSLIDDISPFFLGLSPVVLVLVICNAVPGHLLYTCMYL